MKSRKFKAVLAAVSALAVLATAMTGFAATTTTYNADADKVSVSATLDATTGNEVTYLVTTEDEGVSGTNIVYIDQQTAKDGQVKFDYKIDKGYITSLSTSVTAGSNGDAVEADELTFTEVPAVSTENYTVEYYDANGNEATVYGTEDKVFVKVIPGDKYTVDKILVDGSEVAVTADSFEITTAQVGKVTAEVSLTVVTPNVSAVETATTVVDDNFTFDDSGEKFSEKYADKTPYVTLMKYEGDPDEVGVYTTDVRYPAAKSANGYVAVVIVAANGETVSATPYIIIGDKEYKIENNQKVELN